MLKVGVDVDGVLLDFVGPSMRLFQSIPRNPDKWDLRGYLKTKVEKDAFDALLKDPRYMGNLQILPDIQEQLIPYLRKHDVYIVSSREEQVHRATEERIKSMGLSPVEFRWAKFGNKATLVADLDCHIEDLPIYARNIPPDFPLLMPVRSYNRTYLESNKTERRRLYPYNVVGEAINVLEHLDEMKNKGVYHGEGESGSEK